MMPPRPASRRVPRDVWIGLVALGLAALYWAGAQRIPVSPLDGVVNATAMPRALALALGLFSLLLIARALMVERMTARAAPAPAPPAEGEGRRPTWRQHAKAVGVLLIGVAYLLVLPWIGYVPAMVLLVAAVAIYIGARPSIYTVAVAVAVAVTFWLLFVQFLSIPMPQGIWTARLF